MSSDKTTDIVHRGEEFHRALAKYYRELQHRVTDNSVKMALAFLEQHEQGLESSTRAYGQSVPHPMADRWFSYSPNEELQKLMDSTEAPADLTPAQLSDLAHRFSECITRFYRQFADAAMPEPLAEAFSKLLEMELEGQKKVTNALQQQI